MKTPLLRSFTIMALVCFALALSRDAVAAPAATAGLLVQAYTALDQADHDYKGHRIAAMKHIEAAGRLSGVNVRGDGRGHEKQGVSDEQLRTAQNLLEQARGGLNRKALRRVNRAINEISIALSVK